MKVTSSSLIAIAIAIAIAGHVVATVGWPNCTRSLHLLRILKGEGVMMRREAKTLLSEHLWPRRATFHGSRPRPGCHLEMRTAACSLRVIMWGYEELGRMIGRIGCTKLLRDSH